MGPRKHKFSQFSKDPQYVKYVEDNSDSEWDALVCTAAGIAKKYKVSVADVLLARQILDAQRQNNLYLNNGDTFDEQMADFGDLVVEYMNLVEKYKKPRKNCHVVV